jgi:hypothetical protein
MISSSNSQCFRSYPNTELIRLLNRCRSATRPPISVFLEG